MSNKSSWSAASIMKSLLFRTLTYRAAGFIAKPLLLVNVARKALSKADKDSSLSGMATGALESVYRLVRLVKAYADGSYRDVSKKNAILVVAAVLYFLSPIDIVPDYIPVIGLLDDITLAGWVLSTLGEELTKFEEYESQPSSAVANDLSGTSYQDLYEQAKEQNIPGRSGMSKQELMDALNGAAS